MKPKILIADDDFDNRNILMQVLEANDYEVVQATNGEEAIDMALKELPCLIFLDLSMPKLNGWEAAKRMKQMPEIAHIPIIAFTAHALVGDEAKAKAAGCDSYISKPCAPREIVQKVKDMLQDGKV